MTLLKRRSTPMFMSAEAAECSLACVAMVATFYGCDLDLAGVRKRFPISMKGASLASLISVSAGLGFATRALRAEPADLNGLREPIIAHWNLDHFVVVTKVERRKFYIHDPAQGQRVLLEDEFSRCFTGVILELKPTKNFEPQSLRAKVDISSLWSQLTGFWPVAIQVLLLSLALQIIAFVAPLQLQIVVDSLGANTEADFLTSIAVAFGGIVCLQAATEALRSWALVVMGNSLALQMRGNVIRHLLRLPTAFFEKRHVGDILSRIQSSDTIQTTLTNGAVGAIIDGLMAIISLALLFIYSTQLTVIVLVTLFISIIAGFSFYPVTRRLNSERIAAVANEQSYLMETLRAISLLRAGGVEHEREGQWRNLFSRSMSINNSASFINIITSLLQSIISGLQNVLIIYFGAKLVLARGGMSLGMLVAFLSYRQTFSTKVTSLIKSWPGLSEQGSAKDKWILCRLFSRDADLGRHAGRA